MMSGFSGSIFYEGSTNWRRCLLPLICGKPFYSSLFHTGLHEPRLALELIYRVRSTPAGGKSYYGVYGTTCSRSHRPFPAIRLVVRLAMQGNVLEEKISGN